jgi:hypothetical protein
MKKIHLDNGLQLSVREDVMDNMELLDALVELNEGNGYAISKVINMILEKDEKKKLYDHLRVDGVTSVSKVVEAMKEIFDKLGEKGKNS